MRPGTITLVVGPSGSGKSLLLEAIARREPLARLVHACPFPNDVALIDAVSPTRGVDEALSLLTCCGLGEPRLWVRRFEQLSDGERFRARLARSISLHRSSNGAGIHRLEACATNCDFNSSHTPPLLCDEFGVGLHTRVAKAIAFNLRKLATRERMAMVLATCRDDVEADLNPDVIVRLGGTEGAMRVETRDREKPMESPPFAEDLHVERGSMRDYVKFAPMHYRQRDQVGFVDKVYALRNDAAETFGVVVYGLAALELRARNQATGGRFIRNAALLNRELRVLKRLIIHPDLRGCGLAKRLVSESLPRVGVRFVECLAAMGLVNPVFEKAGMERISICELPRKREELLSELRTLNADPMSAGFESAVCERADVRELVTRGVRDWYRGITAGAEARVARQSARTLARTFRQLAGSQPVYYLWAKDEEGNRLIQDSMAKG